MIKMIKALPAESEPETALPARHPAKIHTMKFQIPHPQICLAAVTR